MQLKRPGISRRNLVKAATIVPFSAIAGSAANSAVKVGLIGSGNRGPSLAGFAHKDSRASIAAISDLFDEQIEQGKKRIGTENPAIYKDYHDLLHSDVDAVIIATPHHLHPEHFEAAVKAKKHIYLEKPVANDVEGCRRIMRAADSADRDINITAGFQRRYAHVYKKAKTLFDSGEIGKIRMARADFIKGEAPEKEKVYPRPATEMEKVQRWKYWNETSGGQTVGNEVHSVDVLSWFLGGHPLNAIGSGGRTARTRGDITDHAYVIYDYPKDVQAVLTGSVLAPRFYRDVKEQFFTPTDIVETSQEYWKHYRGQGHVLAEDSPRSTTEDSIIAFINRIVEGKPENTGVQGAESTLTAFLGYRAVELRREVTWDEMLKG